MCVCVTASFWGQVGRRRREKKSSSRRRNRDRLLPNFIWRWRRWKKDGGIEIGEKEDRGVDTHTCFQKRGGRRNTVSFRYWRIKSTLLVGLTTTFFSPSYFRSCTMLLKLFFFSPQYGRSTVLYYLGVSFVVRTFFFPPEKKVCLLDSCRGGRIKERRGESALQKIGEHLWRTV